MTRSQHVAMEARDLDWPPEAELDDTAEYLLEQYYMEVLSENEYE